MTRKHPAQELEEDVLVRTSNMGQGRSDYEAFHTLSPAIHLREIHTHDFFELYIHLNGFPRLYVDNKIVTPQRGSLMIFPPFVMHGIISQDTIRNYERVVLFISSGMLHQLGQGLLPLEQRLLDCTRRTGYHYQLDEAALSLCTTCIDRVAQNTGDERPESRLADYAAMTEFLLQILRVTQEAPMLQSAQPSPDTIQRVMAYINEHYAQPLTLEEIADAFFISKSYLSHEFVRYTNTSVYEYIQFRRICGAKLLIASAVSLADALRHGTTKGDEGEENRVLGFASRLANTKENPPLVYIGSETKPASMIFTPERVVPEDTSLLEYGILFHDALFIRIANAGWDASQTFKVKNLKFVSMPEYTFEFSMADIAASAENNGKQDAALFTKPISWNAERYNNGFSQVWPAIPDTLEERQALERGETITRPEAPEKTVTAFDATVSGEAALSDTALTITLTFSEALRTGEYAVGMDIAEAWETAWNADGTQMTLTVPADALNGQHTVNLIIFRLMDTDGNLIGGPVELHLNF